MDPLRQADGARGTIVEAVAIARAGCHAVDHLREVATVDALELDVAILVEQMDGDRSHPRRPHEKTRVLFVKGQSPEQARSFHYGFELHSPLPTRANR